LTFNERRAFVFGIPSLGKFDEVGEFFGSGKVVAGQEKIADFGPVDFGQVETEGDPAARTDVGWEIVAFRLGFGEGGVFAGKDFTGDGDDAVTVVVVEEIGEDFFSDQKSGVGKLEFARGFGKS